MAIGLALTSAPAGAESLAEALTGGKASLQLRYRFEHVEQEGFRHNADASILRTQLGYATGGYYGFDGFLQFEDVRVLGDEHFNDTLNGLTIYPVVADPESTEINQAYLGYKGIPGTSLKLGRQFLAYDNHRFIGDVGWRQNQQTFDGFTAVNTSLPGTTVSYAFLENANRIFGERSAAGDVEMKSNLLNVAYRGLPFGSIVGYGYLLDFEPREPIAVTASNQTFGLRFDGGVKIGGPKLLYTAEYAKQSDYADGAATVDADYGYGMLGVDVAGVQVKLHYEKLSGDGTYALQTPFATLHAFNGWADKFLVTPADGLVDGFVSVGGKISAVNLLAVYHLFESDNLGYAYGSELDLLASWKVNKLLTLLVKYADYQGDKNATNVTRNGAAGGAPAVDLAKYWLQAEAAF
jgi:hypothetical protein